MAPHEERSASTPLGHPLFWAALAVLVLNDHLLKGAGLLPGSVTGKLSDFAGLIVAPVLLVSVLRARGRAARIACFGAVAVVFGAINLSPAAARLLEGALGAAGLEWRIWTDPTDLISFAVLPLSWWLLDAGRPRVPRLALQRAGALLGAFACIATGEPPPDPGPPIERIFFTTDAFVSNDTGVAIDLRVRWIDAQVDCAAIQGDLTRAVHGDAFGEGVTFLLGAGSVLPLNRAEATRSLAIDAGTLGLAPSGCDVALLQADRLPATVVFWSGLTVREVSARAAEVLGSDGELRLEGGAEGLGFTAGAGMVSRPYAAVVDPPACDLGTPTAFGWSEIPLELEGLLTLDVVDPGPDGCIAADVRTAADEPHRLFFCVPEWAFPFAPGTEILLHTSPEGGGRTIELAGVDATGAERVLYASHDTAAGAALPVTLSDAEIGCEGERLDCGAYANPRGMLLAGGGEPLLPGDMVDLVPEVHGVSGLLMVGRVVQTVLLPTGCAAAPDLNTRFDAVVLMEVGL